MSKEKSTKKGDNAQAFIDEINSLACEGNTYLYGVNQTKYSKIMPTILAHEVNPHRAPDYKEYRQVCIIFTNPVSASYINLQAIKTLNSLAQKHDMCLNGIDFPNKSLYFIEGGC